MTRTLTTAMIALAIAAAGCSKKDEDKAKKKPTPAKKTPTDNKPDDKKPDTKQPAGKTDLSAVMGAYETIRAMLATDKTDVAAAAGKLASAAKAATVPDAGKKLLADLATAADALAKADAKDATGVRKAYGEVSRAAVALLEALPDVAKNYHMFECPMARGYKRWVQPSKKLHNPYMGSKMPSCGSEVAFGGGAGKMGDHKMGDHKMGDHKMGDHKMGTDHKMHNMPKK